MKISELCLCERPREKMLSAGAQSLSTAELLGVLLRTGTKAENAVDLGRRLLSQSGGNLLTLSSLSLSEICAVNGIKKAKAATLLAAFELGRRLLAESSRFSGAPLCEARQAYEMMIPRMKGLLHEECWVIMLNNSQFILGVKKMTVGGPESTVIDNRGILREMILCGAKALVLVHNHPSGSPLPSKADNSSTWSLKESLTVCGMCLLDHIIVCDDSFYSYAEEKSFKAPF